MKRNGKDYKVGNENGNWLKNKSFWLQKGKKRKVALQFWTGTQKHQKCNWSGLQVEAGHMLYHPQSGPTLHTVLYARVSSHLTFLTHYRKTKCTTSKWGYMNVSCERPDQTLSREMNSSPSLVYSPQRTLPTLTLELCGTVDSSPGRYAYEQGHRQWN